MPSSNGSAKKRKGPREGIACSEAREGPRPAFAIDGDGTVFGSGDFASYQPGPRHTSRKETGGVAPVREWGTENGRDLIRDQVRNIRADADRAQVSDRDRGVPGDGVREFMDACETGQALDEAAFGDRLVDWFGEPFRTEDARLHGRLG